MADGPAATSKPGVEGSHSDSPSAPSPIEFLVRGIPAGKGSKRAFVLRKAGRPTDRAVVVDDNRPALKDWTAAVNAMVQEVARRRERLEGPVAAQLAFYMPKPKSAPKTRKIWPTKKPDLDKLVRAILDPMTGVLFRDDAQVIVLHVDKHYAEDLGTSPGAFVSLREISS